ncbi:MAG: type III secretion system cytoplasmic ring protein SctQ [Janthinobacterium lividum]
MSAPLPASFHCEQVDSGVAVLSRLIGLGRFAELDGEAGTLALSPLTHHETAALDWHGSGALAGSSGLVEVQDMTRFVTLLTGIDLASCTGAHSTQRSWFSSAAAARLSASPLGQVHEILDALPPGSTGAHALRLTVGDGDHAVSMCARADAQTWINLLSQGDWQRRRQPMAGFRQLGMKRSIRLASHTLPASALHALRQGDIVLPDTSLFASDGSGTIVLGRLRLDVRFMQPAALEVLAMSEHITEEKDDGMADPFNDESEVLYHADANSGEDMTDWDSDETSLHAGADDDADDAADEDQDHDDGHDAYGDDLDDGAEQDAGDGEESGRPEGAPVARTAVKKAAALPPQEAQAGMPHDPLLDQLPLTMHFELGQLAMPLGELRGLGAGTILPLQNGSPRSIAICVSGQRLGTGEAVEVDGQLAIRITQWSPSK